MNLRKSILFWLLLISSISASAEIYDESKVMEACSDLAYKQRIQQPQETCVKLVRTGDAHTQAVVGIYFLGNHDYVNAKQWFRKAADKGDPNAQNGLGYLYQFGYGVTQSRKKANDYFLKSAKQGNSDSQFWLGENLILSKDFKEGAYWTDQAARNGSADAQFNLAILYRDGRGVSKDVGYMYFWFTVAATNGHKKSKELTHNLNAELPKDVSEELRTFVQRQLADCPNCINKGL